MILILTEQDLRDPEVTMESVSLYSLRSHVGPLTAWVEDVYFWRDGQVKALKRRNAPLTVPGWLKDREDVEK